MKENTLRLFRMPGTLLKLSTVIFRLKLNLKIEDVEEEVRSKGVRISKEQINSKEIPCIPCIVNTRS